MPNYDYQCQACSYKFEKFQGFNDPILKKCPECKKNKLIRLFGIGAACMVRGGTSVTGLGLREVSMDSAEQKLAARMDEIANS